MKRPATDTPGVEPVRTRRRVASQQPAAILNLTSQPHPGHATDDERANSPPQVLPNGDISILQASPNHNNNGATNVSDMVVRSNRKSQNAIILEIVPKDDGTSTRRPLRRLKLLPPREPSPSDMVVETDSTLNTPIMSPTGLRAPPCSPSKDYPSDTERRKTSRKLSEMPTEKEEWGMELDLFKRSTSPVAVSELFEPEHQVPTPPYYVQHFEEPGFNAYEGDDKSLTSSGRNANTYIRKANFPRPSKRQKTKTWAFKDCEEYPRGETPTIEMILGIEEDDPNATTRTKRDETETETEEDEEVSRDPGISISLTVGIDDAGRFMCKWGACDKSFARNDHLGRHVRVSHLRVRKHRCEPCSMAFIGIKGLRNHERTHNPHASNSETAVSAQDDDAEQAGDEEGEFDFSYRRRSPPISYPISSMPYMFEPDGEEET